MKKIVFAVLILFVLTSSVFAGELSTGNDKGGALQTEEQIIVASANDSCKRECSIDRDTCESDCPLDRSGHKKENCIYGCMRSYNLCLDRCY
jgi:hypothetical protein